MMEFILVLIAVGAVIATKWDSASRWQMGVSGLLSCALGVRFTALVAAGYLLPTMTGYLWADQPVAVQAEQSESVDVEKASSSANVVEKADPSATDVEKADPSATVVEKADPTPADSGPATTTPSVLSIPLEEKKQPDAAKEEYSSHVIYLTPNRPSWLESMPTIDGELYKVAVKAGPYTTVRKCKPDLEREVALAVNDFITDHLRARHASTFFNYSFKDLLERKIVREQFSEQLETSVGLMSQVHAQLVFDNQFRDELDQRWGEMKSMSRLAQTGLGAGIVLLFLGTIFSFLKLDTATRGYYTGRLQFGAAATILALVAASVLLMKWIPWM